LNLDAYSASVTVNDHAKADLNGTAEQFTLTHNYAARSLSDLTIRK
jgi:hypothetical protein